MRPINRVGGWLDERARVLRGRQAQGAGRAPQPPVPAGLQGGRRQRQAARQPLRRARALRRAARAARPRRRAADPRRGRRRRLAPGRRHDRGDRRAAARRHLDLGLLRPHLRGDPRRHELRRAAGARRDGALGLHPARRAEGCRRSTGCSAGSAASSTRSTPTRSAPRLDDVLAGSIEGAGRRPAADPAAAAPRRGPGGDSALAKYATDLTERARGGQDRPGGRPRPGDPPDRRHPDAPAAEQPDPHRRGRRRQDRGGRGLRAAHRRRATCRRRCRT